jgi:hypothetical protein
VKTAFFIARICLVLIPAVAAALVASACFGIQRLCEQALDLMDDFVGS